MFFFWLKALTYNHSHFSIYLHTTNGIILYSICCFLAFCVVYVVGFNKMHLNKHTEGTSESCIFQLGWASSVLAAAEDQPRSVETYQSCELSSSAAILQYISGAIFAGPYQKSKWICICSTRVFNFADPQQMFCSCIIGSPSKASVPLP